MEKYETAIMTIIELEDASDVIKTSLTDGGIGDGSNNKDWNEWWNNN